MRRMHRIVLLAGLLAVAPVLAGCESEFRHGQARRVRPQREEKTAGRAQGGVSGRRAGRHARHSARIPEGQPAAAGDRAGACEPPAPPPTPDGKAAPRQRARRLQSLRPDEPKPKPKRKPKPRSAAACADADHRAAGGQSDQSSDQQQLEPWPNTPPRSKPAPGRVRARLPGRRRRRRPAPSRAKVIVRLREPRPLRVGRTAAHELHHRHYRPAQCRQVDVVQPAGRPARRAGRRPAGRDARPPRRRGPARRSRFHRDRYRGPRAVGARKPHRPHAGADRNRDGAGRRHLLHDRRARRADARPTGPSPNWCANPASRPC